MKDLFKLFFHKTNNKNTDLDYETRKRFIFNMQPLDKNSLNTIKDMNLCGAVVLVDN